MVSFRSQPMISNKYKINSTVGAIQVEANLNIMLKKSLVAIYTFDLENVSQGHSV